MCGIPLEIVEQYNYLGVCLYHRMSWQPHIDYICDKANCFLVFLHRNLWHCPSKLKKCTHKQLILLTLDYNTVHQSGTHINTNWSTSLKWYNIVGAARFVTVILNKPWSKHYHDSISEMLHKLNWPALQTKRKQARLIFLFKMLNKQISIPDQYLPSPFPVTATRSRHLLNCSNSTQEQIYITIHFYPEQFLDWNNLAMHVLKKSTSWTSLNSEIV